MYDYFFFIQALSFDLFDFQKRKCFTKALNLNDQSNKENNHYMSWSTSCQGLTQCFPTIFGSRHLYLVLKITGGTPNGFIRYKDQEIVTIGSTPGTSSRHTSVPRHPGWEPLLTINFLGFCFTKKWNSFLNPSRIKTAKPQYLSFFESACLSKHFFLVIQIR